jgi:selenide,water dikinase
VIRNNTARAGDQIILTKRLGVGIYSAALKRKELDASLYEEMVRSMTQLNAVGAELRAIAGVHAMTDVTGFGLLGHLLEMCRGASLGAELHFESLPLLAHTQRLAEIRIGTGGAKRNWQSYGHEVDLPVGAPEWWRGVLCDPQTSGGLLIACSKDSVPQLLNLLRNRDFIHASVLGEFGATEPRVRIG